MSTILVILNLFIWHLGEAKFSKLDLGGKWLVTGINGTVKIQLNGSVPGGIYSDLMDNNVIGDIFFEYGDEKYSWVANVDWIYSLNFSLKEEFLHTRNIYLIFEGLDTYSRIFLNNKKVGRSTNMFVRYILPVKDVLREFNQLEVRFVSPVLKAIELANENEYELPFKCPPKEYKGHCNIKELRKMQISFGGESAPAFPSVGIWKDVYLQSFNTAVIEYIMVKPTKTDNFWKLTISTNLRSGTFQNIGGRLIYFIDTDYEQIVDVININTTAGVYGEIVVEHTLDIPKETLQLWWPNGYGSPNTYPLLVKYENENEVHTKRIQFGLKNLRLYPKVLDADNKLRYFEINDMPIFAKGADLLPCNILPEKSQDIDLLKDILQAAKDVNMNILRVWGGGIYQSDQFYEMADELGILIWQDFMFVSTFYPNKDYFLTTVSQEVNHQIKRLNFHPSIVIWSASTGADRAFYDLTLDHAHDYKQLFIEGIMKEAENILHPISSAVVAPTLDAIIDKNTLPSSDPSKLNESAKIPTFVSEYGSQSLPDFDSWLTVTNNIDNLDPLGKFINHRQHFSSKICQFNQLIERELDFPEADDINYVNKTIYYSQIVQALSVKKSTEDYRSDFDGTSQEHAVAQTLFFHLNDVWIAPTWSSIDYTGRWKMLHYFAKDFFAPIIILGKLYEYNNNLRLFLVCDPSESSLEVTVTLNVYSWDSITPFSEMNITAEIIPGGVKEIVIDDVLSLLTKAGCAEYVYSTCFFYFTAIDENEDEIAPPNFLIPAPLKECDIQIVNLKITSIIKLKRGSFKITLQSDGIALFVWLSSHQIVGRFSENGFLQVNEYKHITFTTDSKINVTKLYKILTVTYLNTYVTR